MLLVSPLPPPEGGISTWTRQVAEVVAASEPGIDLRILDTAVRWRAVTRQSMLVRLAGGSVHAISQIRRFLKVARSWRPQVVHLCTSAGVALFKDYVILKCCRLLGIPAVIHFRFGRIPALARRQNREWRMLRRVIQLASRVIVLDRASFAVLRHEFGDKVARLPNFIDVDALNHELDNGSNGHAEGNGSGNGSADARSVVFVGHVLPTKGVRELVAGCRKLADEIPDLRLRIVGPYSPSFRSELTEIAGGEQASGRWLEFAGAVPRRRALEHMASADVFCLPTYTEGFPNSLLEAMAMAKPIVATPVGAVPEMLHFGSRQPCGVVAQAQSASCVADSIRRVLDDPTGARKMARRAQQRCRRAYDAERTVGRLTKLWQSTAADGLRISMHRAAATSPPSILVINQVAGPLTVELVARLSQRGWDCQVLCGEIEAEAGLRDDVDVIQGEQLIKSSDWWRLWTWLRFTCQAVATASRERRRSALVVTNPPFTMLTMPFLRRIAGVRYALLIHDLYPDVAERMNVIRPRGVIARIWRALSRTAFVKATTVVAIGDLMARLLREHLHGRDRINLRVIPTWVNTSFIRPVNKSQNPFVAGHHLADKFVVMYSGAFGATHHLQTFIDAAALLTDEPSIHFVLIGGGTSARELQRMLTQRPLSNVTLLGFQPWESVPYSLGSADCSVVSLDAAYGGVSVPSKAYYALASGSALIAVAPDDSELSALVNRHNCGVQVRPHDARALATAVRGLYHDPQRLGVIRRNARRTAEQHFSFVQLDRLCDELTSAIGQPRGRRSLIGATPAAPTPAPAAFQLS